MLSPGGHAEHRARPFCHVPCYAALFGPKLFGHGSTTESHRSFGRRESSFIREQTESKERVDEYNQYYGDSPKHQVSFREVNGRYLLEGIVKIYWGTEGSVRLLEYSDSRVVAGRHRTSTAPRPWSVQIPPAGLGEQGSCTDLSQSLPLGGLLQHQANNCPIIDNSCFLLLIQILKKFVPLMLKY